MSKISNPINNEFNKIRQELLNSKFTIPINQDKSKHYFPLFLSNILDEYLEYYNYKLNKIGEHIKNLSQNGVYNPDILPFRVDKLVNGIKNAVSLYYEGNLREASELFDNSLDEIFYSQTTTVTTIPSTSRFYRARLSSGRRFTRTDLFHNPFENRHLVATSRYSIPGLPALYLGSSAYVCWEEFNQPQINNLYFSQFRSNTPLKVIPIQRIEDFFNEITNTYSITTKFISLVRYTILLPLFIACSIRTKNINGTFKPEYIIPQLLLQYVTKNKDIDGIMFPSTKVEYSLTYNLSSYNYVFPVKNISSNGYCTKLSNVFSLTQPTSSELESMINFTGNHGYSNPSYPVQGEITIIEGEITPYRSTVFGRIEEILHTRPSAPLDIFA